MDKVAVVGGRDFKDRPYLFFVLDKYHEKHGISHIVSGGAKGADSLAELYAKDRCIPYTVYPADWDTHGKQAGFIRNSQIANDCDVLIAFPTKESVGTWHTVELAEKSYYKKVFVLDKYYK